MTYTKRILILCLFVSSTLGFLQILTPAVALAMDQYEPNDSFMEAYELDFYSYDRFNGIQASQEDADYYKIFEETEDPFDYRCELILEYDPEQNDLWLEIYDENQTLILTLDTPNGEEKGNFLMEFNVTYYILIQGENTGFPYSLSYGVFLIESIEDEFENYNDDDWFFERYYIKEGGAPIQPNTTYSDLTISGGEEDWYGFAANAGDIVNISIETNATSTYDVHFGFDSGDNNWDSLMDQSGTFSFQRVLYFDKNYQQNEYGSWVGDLYFFYLSRHDSPGNPLIHYNFTVYLTSSSDDSAQNDWVGLQEGDEIRGEKTTISPSGGENENIHYTLNTFINDSEFLEIQQYSHSTIYSMNQTKTLASGNHQAYVNDFYHDYDLFPEFYYLEPVAFDFREHDLNATWENKYTFNGTYLITENGKKLEVHGRFEEIGNPSYYKAVNLTIHYDAQGVLSIYEFEYSYRNGDPYQVTYYEDANVIFEDAYEYFDYNEDYWDSQFYFDDQFAALENGFYPDWILGGTDFVDTPIIYLHAGSKVTIDIIADNASMNAPLVAQFEYWYNNPQFIQIEDDMFHLQLTTGIMYTGYYRLYLNSWEMEEFSYNITITEQFGKPIEPSPYWFGFGEDALLAWTFDRSAVNQEHRVYTVTRDIDSLHFENNIASYIFNETIEGNYYYNYDYEEPYADWYDWGDNWFRREELISTGMGYTQRFWEDQLSNIAHFPLVNSRYFLFGEEYVDTYYRTQVKIEDVNYTLSDGNRTIYLEFDYVGQTYDEDVNGYHQYWVSYTEGGLLESFQFYRYQEDVLLTNRSIDLTQAVGLVEEVPDDTTPPVITLVSPVEGGTYPQGTAIDFTVEDPYLWRVYARWDDGFETDITGSNVAYLPNSEGSHTLYIRATDMLGNEANASYTFTANAFEAPHIELLSPLPNREYPALTNITFDVTGPAIAEVYITWDDGSETLVSGEDYRTVLPESPGEHVLIIRAVSVEDVENFARFTFITEGEVIDDPTDDDTTDDDTTDDDTTDDDTTDDDTTDDDTTDDDTTDNDTADDDTINDNAFTVPGYDVLSFTLVSLSMILGILVWRRKNIR